jgi:biopolymer transport protein ExbB/TolQ
MALVSGLTWQIVAWSIVGLLLAGQALWYWRNGAWRRRKS